MQNTGPPNLKLCDVCVLIMFTFGIIKRNGKNTIKLTQLTMVKGKQNLILKICNVYWCPNTIALQWFELKFGNTITTLCGPNPFFGQFKWSFIIK